MKITGLEIGEYRQLKDIKFDFTYPEGHEKAGQPLDKVCFIGQSGTGKSTLLQAIRRFILAIDKGFSSIVASKSVEDIKNDFLLWDFHENIFLSTNWDTGNIKFDGIKNGEASDIVEWISKNDLQTEISHSDKLCLYIGESAANEASNILKRVEPERFSGGIAKTQAEIDKEKENIRNRVSTIASSKIIGLNFNNSVAFWSYILRDIIDYDEKLKEIATELIKKVDNISADKIVNSINDWKLKNPNPRFILADQCLSPLLSKFHLDIDKDSTEAPITIKTKAGRKLASSFLSTGTKQLIATAIPIFKLNTEKSLILFDEPERSLFPDIQRGIIEYYTSLAPTAQFFFATHSPIIASAFEPCERFILYFDENGEVKFRNGVAPEGDDPNDVLRQDFGMSPLMLDKGVEAYREYLALATKIRNEPDKNRKMELIVERASIGNKYNFSATDETN